MPFHLAIVGGGMVGAALAVSLKNTHLKVVLIDAAPLHSPEDSRLIALNHSSVCLFEELGIWSVLKPFAAPIEQIHVSHRGHFGMTRMHCHELNVRALGYVVPAKYINAALYSALSAPTAVPPSPDITLCNPADMMVGLGGTSVEAALSEAKPITLIRPARVEALVQSEHGVALDIVDDNASRTTVHANVVIAADGSFSTVRDLLNIPVEKIDYQQSALVTRTILQRGHDHVAYERFQAEGAIAMLPLPGNEAATIWTASNERIKQLMQLTDDAFLKELQTHFGYRLGRFLKTEQRFVYPLQMVLAKQRIQQHVMLVGNAAHTFHPIASQGLNLALSEIRYLANFFQKPMEKVTLQNVSMDFSQEHFSRRLSHHLTWIFSSDYFVLDMARQVGMIGLDVLPSLKKHFAWRAMGKRVAIFAE